ncbi:helix-turn-helix transcriptional regulator [Christiangramia aestuarii]|uniref:Helix-turn-helix transcriptional regulator n=1 Tax=Christiangramia aestuarii TaxID=1028746 RepID=A0A7M3SYP4_9FLAO|nr:helix-turn-helix transcriptional regulator [Christiangramia aestuarii]
MGSKLNFSGHTVNTHKKNILRKTDSRNSTQLVSNFWVEGLTSFCIIRSWILVGFFWQYFFFQKDLSFKDSFYISATMEC